MSEISNNNLEINVTATFDLNLFGLSSQTTFLVVEARLFQMFSVSLL